MFLKSTQMGSTLPPIPSNSTRKKRGQSTLEFALLLPILILIVIGATDLGRAYHVMITVSNAAREGARQAVYDYRLGYVAQIRNAAIREATNTGLTILSADVSLNCGANGPLNSGSNLDPLCNHLTPLRVTVCSNFRLILEIFFSGPIPICRYAEMMIP